MVGRYKQRLKNKGAVGTEQLTQWEVGVGGSLVIQLQMFGCHPTAKTPLLIQEGGLGGGVNRRQTASVFLLFS